MVDSYSVILFFNNNYNKNLLNKYLYLRLLLIPYVLHSLHLQFEHRVTILHIHRTLLRSGELLLLLHHRRHSDFEFTAALLLRNITNLAQLQPLREIRHLALKLSNACVPAPQLLLPTLREPRLLLRRLVPQLPYHGLQLMHTDLTAFKFVLVAPGAFRPYRLILDFSLQPGRELLELLHAPLELLRLVAPLLHILLQSLDD